MPCKYYRVSYCCTPVIPLLLSPFSLPLLEPPCCFTHPLLSVTRVGIGWFWHTKTLIDYAWSVNLVQAWPVGMEGSWYNCCTGSCQTAACCSSNFACQWSSKWPLRGAPEPYGWRSRSKSAQTLLTCLVEPTTCRPAAEHDRYRTYELLSWPSRASIGIQTHTGSDIAMRSENTRWLTSCQFGWLSWHLQGHKHVGWSHNNNFFSAFLVISQLHHYQQKMQTLHWPTHCASFS